MNTKKTNAESQPPIDGNFINFLQNHRRGEIISDLSSKVRELVDAVTRLGKGGTMMLKISVKPASKGGALVIEDEIKVAPPKEEVEGSIFFADKDGNLLREDPNQRMLPLKSIKGGVPEEEQQLRRAQEQQ